jgi:hypothetical protein
MLADRAGRCLFGTFCILYLITARGWVEVGDTWYSIRTARALLERGRLDLRPDNSPTMPDAETRGPDGRSYSKYGIGLPLILLAPVACGHVVALSFHGAAEDSITGFLVSFANVPFGLLTVAVFWQTVRLFGARPAYANLLTCGLGLGSLCWRYAICDYSEAVQTALLLTAVYGCLRGETRSTATGGIAAAGLVLVKLVHFALMPWLVIYLISQRSQTWRERMLNTTMFLVPLAVAAIVLGALNVLRFGNILESGYGAEAERFSVAQLPHTIPQLLLSLDKGLLVYCPIVILGILGLPRFFLKWPRETGLVVAIVLTNLGLTAAWWSWVGGWSWGPRLLVPAIPLMLLPAVALMPEPPSRRRYLAVAGVTLISVVAQIPGVLVTNVMIEAIRDDQLSQQEREQMLPMYPAAVVALWHKTAIGTDVYPVSLFGVSGNRSVDVGALFSPRLRGFSIWTEQVARWSRHPRVRWLPVPALVLALFLAVRAARLLANEVREWPSPTGERGSCPPP